MSQTETSSISAVAGAVTPSRFAGDGAVDVAITLTIGGAATEGEVTLGWGEIKTKGGDVEGYSAWGASPDQWVSGQILTATQDLDGDDLADVLGQIESVAVAAAEAAHA